MATRVGFISEKGGVGKTTACYHIATCLSQDHGKNVLVVDTDYQRGGITGRFLPDLIEHFRGGELPGITLNTKFQQLYSGQKVTTEVDIRETQEGPDLIAADPRLSQVTVEKMPGSNSIRVNNQHLWNHLSLLDTVLRRFDDEYDYILIDSHPDISDVLRCVIYACDYCVSPVKLDLQSTIGVATALEAINEVNADVAMIHHAIPGLIRRDPAQFVGAMGMMSREWGGNLKQTEWAEFRRLQRSGGIFENYVTEGDGLRQAARDRVPVFQIKGANAEKQSQQFRNLTTEFITKCPQK